MVQSPFKLINSPKGWAVIQKDYDGTVGLDMTAPLDSAIGEYDFACAQIEEAASLPYKHRSKIEIIGKENLQAAGKLYASNLIEHRKLQIVGASGLEAACSLYIYSGERIKRLGGSFHLRFASPNQDHDILYTIARHLGVSPLYPS